jgi:hypothetical protein
MPYKFNPFTNALDYFESGGGGGASYIDGEVATYTDLPLDGSAALNTAWLVREASGTWLIARKPAGIYIRTATAGVSRDADWTYAGILPDVFNDANFLLYDNADSSKNLAFQLSGISTGTTRTVDAPAGNGRMLVEGQSIGSTTAAAGTFTTLAANNGTLTASAPVLDLAQTWNASGTTFTGLRFNVTNTASAVLSNLVALQVGGTDRFRVRNDGFVTIDPSGTNNAVAASTSTLMSLFGVVTRASGQFAWTSGINYTDTTDVILVRDGAAGTLAQRNGTNAQTFNIYNTFTSATNHERLRLAWASNVAIIGTEKGSGGGSARALELQTDGVTRLTVQTGGTVALASHLTVENGFIRIASAQAFQWLNRSKIYSLADGNVGLYNAGESSFNLLQFGGTTTSFPALKRSSTVLQARLANDSDFCPLQGQLRTHANAVTETITADKTLTFYDAAGTAYKVPCVAA